MGRLRLQNANNYVSSGNISAEFENLIRYLVSAEKGNLTLGEMLDQIFDEDGLFSGPIELRLDATSGLQFRVGVFTDPEEKWQNIVDLEDIRGAPGLDVGQIGAPILFDRQDTVGVAAQTVIGYSHDETDGILVYVDGILMTEGASFDYTTDSVTNEVILTSALAGTENITLYKIRETAITNYNRQDTLTTASQAVFPFVHDADTVLQVYKNGVLQRFGGSFDYTTDPATDTVTFTSTIPSGNLVSIITVENTALNNVTGLMTEGNFTDTATGKILYATLAINDEDITQAKVEGLVSHIATAAKLVVASSTPGTPATGDLWLDTSVAPNVLKYYDGTQYLRTSPESGLPPFVAADANKIIGVNGTGTALEYRDIDLSSVIPVTQKGASNGVATLDSDGNLPSSQLPSVLASGSLYKENSGATADGDYKIQRVFKQRLSVTGVSLRCSAGTANVQLLVNGVAVGTAQAVSTTPSATTFPTAQEVDATAASALLGFQVTSQSSLADLEVTYSYAILSS